MIVFLFGINLKFKGNAFAGLTAGILDEVKTWNDSEIAVADFDRSLLESCYPPSDHFTEEGYNSAIAFLKKGRKDEAVTALTTSVLETATPYCVTVFKKVVTQVASECPRLLSDALPMAYF